MTHEVCAFVAAGQFSVDPSYRGHVLVVPIEHHENLYVVPDPLLGRVAALCRRVSIAFRRLGADGTSPRQHDERRRGRGADRAPVGGRTSTP